MKSKMQKINKRVQEILMLQKRRERREIKRRRRLRVERKSRKSQATKKNQNKILNKANYHLIVMSMHQIPRITRSSDAWEVGRTQLQLSSPTTGWMATLRMRSRHIKCLESQLNSLRSVNYLWTLTCSI
jgi:hypothetical protein